MGIGIDMCTDLHASQPEFSHGGFRLASGEVWILHRNCAKSYKAFRILADHLRNMVVKAAREVEPISGFGPITKHNWDSGKRLDRDPRFVAFFNPAFGVPSVIRDLAEDALPNHHSVATGFVMFEPCEPAISVLGIEIWPVAGKNMRV